MPMKNPPHPGLSVRHDCLEPFGLSVTEAARKLGVSRKQIEQRTEELERRGVLVGPREPRSPFEGGVYVVGALKTFLGERG